MGRGWDYRSIALFFCPPFCCWFVCRLNVSVLSYIYVELCMFLFNLQVGSKKTTALFWRNPGWLLILCGVLQYFHSLKKLRVEVPPHQTTIWHILWGCIPFLWTMNLKFRKIVSVALIDVEAGWLLRDFHHWPATLRSIANHWLVAGKVGIGRLTCRILSDPVSVAWIALVSSCFSDFPLRQDGKITVQFCVWNDPTKIRIRGWSLADFDKTRVASRIFHTKLCGVSIWQWMVGIGVFGGLVKTKPRNTFRAPEP